MILGLHLEPCAILKVENALAVCTASWSRLPTYVTRLWHLLMYASRTAWDVKWDLRSGRQLCTWNSCNTHNTVVQAVGSAESVNQTWVCEDCVEVCCVPSVLARPWSECILYVRRSYLCSYNRTNWRIVLWVNLTFVTHGEVSVLYCVETNPVLDECVTRD